MDDLTFWAIVAIAIYFLPTIVAMGNDHASGGSVFFVNLFFGWTILGWLICLIWACEGRKNSEPKSTPIEYVVKGQNIIQEETKPSSTNEQSDAVDLQQASYIAGYKRGYNDAEEKKEKDVDFSNSPGNYSEGYNDGYLESLAGNPNRFFSGGKKKKGDRLKKMSKNEMLLHAVQFGTVNQVRTSILEKANVNFINMHGNTPLHLAGIEGHMKKTQILVDAGAKVTAKNNFGQTPKQLAKKYNHDKVVKFLAEREAENFWTKSSK